MRFTTTSTTALVAALSSTTSAAPAPQTTVTPGAPTYWSVSNFALGCSPGGCTYDFSMSGPATTGVGPAFSTSCSGSDVQPNAVACASTEFYADLISTGAQGLVLIVNRFAKQTNGDTAVMSGNATAAPQGGPAYESFQIAAKSYGIIVGGGN